MKRVLVTGATGFAGRHLVHALAARGYRVRALVRDRAKADGLQRDHVELVVGDVTDPENMDEAVAGCGIVFHTAAVHREARYSDDMYWHVNVRGTETVADAALRHGVERFLHCSTTGVHGETYVPADELAPLAPEDIYQVTKLAAERLLHERFAQGLIGTIVRPVGIYGPGDTRFLKLFRAIRSGAFRMIGSGNTVNHLLYIDDFIEAMTVCAEHPRAEGETYILAGPRYTTLNDLVNVTAKAVGAPPPSGHVPLRPVMLAARLTERVCRPLGIEPPLHQRRVAFFVKNRGFCSAKITRELGYVPQVDLEEGLVRTAAWYRAHGLL